MYFDYYILIREGIRFVFLITFSHFASSLGSFVFQNMLVSFSNFAIGNNLIFLISMLRLMRMNKLDSKAFKIEFFFIELKIIYLTMSKYQHLKFDNYCKLIPTKFKLNFSPNCTIRNNLLIAF